MVKISTKIVLFLSSTLFILGLSVLSGCSATAFETEVKVDPISSIPTPNITAINIEGNTQEITFLWSVNSTENVAYYNIYHQNENGIGYDLFLEHVTSNALNTTANTTKKLPDGFKRYFIRVRTVDKNLVEGNASDVATMNYRGTWDFDFQFGSIGNDDGQFLFPTDVAIDANGNIYISDTGNHRIQKFNSAGVYSATLGTFGSNDWQFNSPRGISISSTGLLYVADSENDRVVFFDPDNFGSGTFGILSTGLTFSYPTAVAVSSDDKISISDLNNNKIHYFNSVWAQFGIAGTAAGQIQSAVDLDIYSNQSFVLDKVKNKVTIYDDLGNFQSEWGNSGSTSGAFNAPHGLSVSNEGTVYISDTGNNRVQVYTNGGAITGQWGQLGTDPGEFNQPKGIQATPEKLFVVDSLNHRVQVFKP